jgi:putative salt-induced outer membrane protein YdiY
VYPGLKSGSGLLLRSETAFVNPLQANLDLEIKYILDYNSEPAGKKKTDTQIIAGLKYKF